MNKQSKIGILGGGVEGQAAALYFLGHGFEDVTIFDEREDYETEIEVKVVRGSAAFEEALHCDVLLRSPGIHAARLEAARSRGATVTSTIQYFLEHAPGKVIGVTGTKGKGTTSTLIQLILKEDGRDVYLGGNIGESPLSFLDILQDDSWSVLELSSFQLQDLTQSPHIGVVLMVTQEHLDYHKDRQEYVDAKAAIGRFQPEDGMLVVNVDYDVAGFFLKQGNGVKVGVSRNKADFSDISGLEHRVFVENGRLWVDDEEVLEVSKIALPGGHNVENVLAAVAVARLVGVVPEVIRKVVYSFTGLPHRLELVREVGGVRYYNDSFSTTPETCIAAVRAFEDPLILLAGGSEKYSDYSAWAAALQERSDHIKLICLMGVTAPRMEQELRAAAHHQEKHPLAIQRCAHLQEAFSAAQNIATSGDIVLLSPAAASFDLFKNYKERGELFKELVENVV